MGSGDTGLGFVGNGGWNCVNGGVGLNSFSGNKLCAVKKNDGVGFLKSRAGSQRKYGMFAVKKEFKRLEDNVEGEMFVDSSCIDCDTCRWMAPNTFARAHGLSYVHTQPSTENPEDRLDAFRAMISCPTSSIRLEKPRTSTQLSDIQKASSAIPYAISSSTPDVLINGYKEKMSFAATSYTVRSNKETNSPSYIVDVPRFTKALGKQILAALGGESPKYMFLSHRDDVGEHYRWAELLGVQRIIHEKDVSSRDRTNECEIQLTGDGPWKLWDGAEIIAVPGHTAGSIMLYDEYRKVVFTGDHVAFSGGLNKLTGFPRYNWYSLKEQMRSMEKLLDLDFEWLCPGHGRMRHYENVEVKNREFLQLLSESNT
mmetsp:Transcript_6501/g.11617  ORF Transcript_6501/g.11617 Transcript_6501/m.11617 type:complete len:370 (-) Transcript_6501:1732-2841(-)